MIREHKPVLYSYEFGDESLPHLKDLVSDKEDLEKNKILTYLKTNCIAACPGIVKDIIHPDYTIGFGNSYSDGTYFWDDVFCNYVEKYNIPVPSEFRKHILENYDARMKRHSLLQLVDSVEIQNNPYLGYPYNTRIYKNGVIKYQNYFDNDDESEIKIKREDAEYIINPIMTEIFCYDSDNHGQAIIDGYHWKLTFYKMNRIVEEIEGWPGEDTWRYSRVKAIIEFAERFIPKDLGSKYMTYKQKAEMKVKYTGESSVSLTKDKIYDVLEIEGEGELYRIVDDTEEDYLFSREIFEIIETE